jgi:hypothetical protein
LSALSKIASRGEILADKITITYFMEDAAHEAFMRSIVQRIAKQEGITRVSSDVRSARGGFKMIGVFKSFVREYSELLWSLDRVLVVIRDCNCMTHNKRLKELKEPLIGLGLGVEDRVVFGLPDPHIERWYIADQRAFNQVIGAHAAPPVPRVKCGKNAYKNILRQALETAGIKSRSGGSEYGGPIAAVVNTDDLQKADHSFKRFADDLRRAFKQVQSASE